MNVPLDETHTEALVYVEQIRRHTRAVQCEIDRWEPAPCPTERTGDTDMHHHVAPSSLTRWPQ